MKGYIEKMIREYPKMVRERECLRKKIESCEFLSADELISALNFSHPEGERTQSSDVTDKTARIAFGYQEKLDKINDELIAPMREKYELLDEEIVFFEESVRSLPGEINEPMCALFLKGMTWDDAESCFSMNRRTISDSRKKAIYYLVRCYQKRASIAEAELLS